MLLLIRANSIGWASSVCRPMCSSGASTAIRTPTTPLLLPAGQSNVQPLGTLLALVAGASYAALTVTGRRVVLHTDSPDATMAVFFSTGALLIVPVLAFQDLHRLASLPGVEMIAWLGGTIDGRAARCVRSWRTFASTGRDRNRPDHGRSAAPDYSST